jgi:hypothetical protein
VEHLPRIVKIKKILLSRYGANADGRPISWDERKAGYDQVESSEGEHIFLVSSGGQSVPKVGWSIVLIDPVFTNQEKGYTWTVYGMAPQSNIQG